MPLSALETLTDRSAYMYGAHVGEGSLTQHISGAFKEGVRK